MSQDFIQSELFALFEKKKDRVEFNMKLYLQIWLVISLTLIVGCGKSGSNRVRAYGDVSWKGQPIPCGIITFSPDRSKGTNGPEGFALIENGKYDTSSSTAKGCVPGKLFVTITGGDGKNRKAQRSYGDLLFSSYRTSVEIPKEGGKIDFVIPDDVKPAPAKSDDAE